jgi:hypothetical protein
MLLLLVLTMLALFVLLGAFLLVTAIRSRAAARAFADATQGPAVDRMQARALLDEALLIALRGSKDPSAKSILGDKYGPASGSCTVALAYDAGAPVLVAPISGFSLNPRAMFGRVLTLSTTSSAFDAERGLPVSFRILGASSGTASAVLLANAPARPGLRLPAATGTYSAVINGREFAVEPWDAFDDNNIWLAQPVVQNGQIVRFQRASFAGATTPTVDNDNDGVADGVWLPNVLAPRVSPRSGTFSYRVSYLILDLDGRINVNACTFGSGSASGTTPLGMGYGPADVDATGMLTTVSGSAPLTVGGGGVVTTSTGQPTPDQRRPPPGLTVGGRFGRNGLPGSQGDDESQYQQTNVTGVLPSYGRSLYSLTVAGTNTVADLNGQVRVSMLPPTGTQIMSMLRFDLLTTGTDGIDDGYEVRLDAAAPRQIVAVSGSAPAGLNDDNPYGVADMERLLRADDADAAALPQRLAAALGQIAQRSRMRVTTDSWDTPALTGSAAAAVEAFLTGATPPLVYPWQDVNPVSPDVAAGLRFNLNRPVRPGTTLQAVTEQQEYCKGLYTLVRALGGLTARQAAQWAVNVLDFRDEDSTMSRFVYDTNLADGWNPMDPTTSGTVFGVERPDLVITETAGWWDPATTTGQLFVNLHRPAWNARVARSSGTSPCETLAAELLSGTDGMMSIADKIENVSGTSGVWQVRYDANKVAKFHAVPGGAGMEMQWAQTTVSGTPAVTGTTVNVVGSASGAAPVPANGYVCVQAPPPGLPMPTFTVSGVASHVVGMASGTTDAFSRATPGSVTLERLADPTRPNGPDNPYVAVDVAPVDVRPSGVLPLLKRRRPGPTDSTTAHPLANFWRSPAEWRPVEEPTIGPYSAASVNDPVPWLHWPNRPFVSHAELALVPADGPDTFLRNYSFPPSSFVAMPAGRPLLDAVHVPSRFAGTSLTLPAGSGTVCGLDLLRVGQISAWREPGRVNVNTIVSGVDAVVSVSGTSTFDSLVWSTLVGGTLPVARGTPMTTGTLVGSPFVSVASMVPPAYSTAQLLSLLGLPDQPIAVDFSTSGTSPCDRNPFLAYATAIRLANTATIRSNVFAIWITLETTDSADGSVTYHRLFAIVDRSIPVGFRQGENLNVRDTIRLQRFLE